MLIPKFNKEVNSYSQKFCSDFYFWFNNWFDIEHYEFTLNDKNVINKIIYKYYSFAFYMFHKENKELLRSPDLAIEFNVVMTILLVHITGSVFYMSGEDLSENRRDKIYETLIRKTIYKWYNTSTENITEFELVQNLLDYIIDEFQNLVQLDLSEWKYDMDSKVHFFTKFKFMHNILSTGRLKEQAERVISFSMSIKLWVITLMQFIMLMFFLPSVSLFVFKYRIILVVAFYIAFFAILGWCVFENFRVKKKIDILEKFSNNRLYERLGVDILCIRFALPLFSYFDPDKENNLIPSISDFRLDLIDKIGWVLPSVRVLDDSRMDNGISIDVRGREVLHFDFYTNKFIIFENDAKINNIMLPDNKIECAVEERTYYWVAEDFCKDLDREWYLTRDEFIKYILNYVAFCYIDEIFTIEDAYLLREIFAGSLSGTEREECYDTLSIFDLREIFVKIIQRGGSVKDIKFVRTKIMHYWKKTSDLDYIAFLVCNDLAVK